MLLFEVVRVYGALTRKVLSVSSLDVLVLGGVSAVIRVLRESRCMFESSPTISSMHGAARRMGERSYT